MPTRSKRPCSVPGCPVLTADRWCEGHATNKHIARAHDQRRGSSSARGYDAAWRKLRLVALLRDNYLCQICLKDDRPTPARDVDHILTVAEHPELRLELDNLQSLCSTCHKKKTYEEDGAFGRKP